MKRTKIIRLMFGILLVLVAGLVSAHEHDFTEAKQLVDSGVSCDNLTDEQLEMIGDYYMEQMHPGEAHEYMDEMMGGEGSESLKQVHINMARNIYCGESGNMMGGGMMSMMSMMMGSGGMMGNSYYQNPQNNNSFGFQIFFYILLALIMVILVLVIILLINKLKKHGGKR
ncbi:hypothetical protein COU53_02550 [Candidatus Pacearchaeota archaeon CG10_big_fil_rev_8_21_14_0_10_30_48]|nr:MAG: hypothetical protein COU53_02550 [Candidatus Pacearchaeota archaeon CG10_big_fil_rev_8_21_14_0_10_30_48]